MVILGTLIKDKAGKKKELRGRGGKTETTGDEVIPTPQDGKFKKKRSAIRYGVRHV